MHDSDCARPSTKPEQSPCPLDSLRVRVTAARPRLSPFPLRLLLLLKRSGPSAWSFSRHANPSRHHQSESLGLNQVSFSAMSSRRLGINATKCGTHSTPSETVYLDTSDSREVVNCQSTDNDGDSYSVKHQFPSPIISWIEDVSSFGDASFSPDTEYVDEHTRSSVGHSLTSTNLHEMQISFRLTDEFLELAKENTSNNLETCGILGASFRDGTYFVTMLIIPKQEGTAHSCQAVNEEEIHAVLSEQALYPAGWIHTHPSQTCFLSSIDLHTQFSYQVMLPEAVAIVVAPTDPTRSYGIFRLTDPAGMDVLRGCDESGFHTHRETTDGTPIYETCSNVHFKPNLRFEIVDLRSVR